MSIDFAEPAAVATPSQRTKTPAALGITGLLVAALIAFAVAPTLLPDSYSWVEHGISESAAQGIDGSWAARGGFILFGLGVLCLVGTMTLIVARRNRSIRAAIPDWIAFLVAAIVPLTASTSAWGALQRTMFLVSIGWFIREAWRAEPIE